MPLSILELWSPLGAFGVCLLLNTLLLTAGCLAVFLCMMKRRVWLGYLLVLGARLVDLVQRQFTSIPGMVRFVSPFTVSRLNQMNIGFSESGPSLSWAIAYFVLLIGALGLIGCRWVKRLEFK